MFVYLVTLVLTIGIELAIVAAIRLFVPQLRKTPSLSTCLCLNLLTHPLASTVYLLYSFPFLIVELAVVVAELIGYRYVGGIPVKWSFTLALLSNVASLLVGCVAF